MDIAVDHWSAQQVAQEHHKAGRTDDAIKGYLRAIATTETPRVESFINLGALLREKSQTETETDIDKYKQRDM